MVGELTMSFFEHLEELRRRLIICIIAFIVVLVIVFTLGIRQGELWGYTVYYPFPDFFDNMPAQLFERFKADLLPANVVLLNIGGADALLVDIKLGMFLAFAVCTPVFAWQASRFIMPALYPNERSFAAKIVLPTTVLFIIGCLVSYLWFTPFALDFFFRFSEELAVGIPDAQGNISPTIGVSNFLSWITMMVLAFGVVFELPVFMAALTKLGLVSYQRWLSGWRYAIVAFLIVGGIITPDASGVTQILVAIPMFGLYMLGVAWTYMMERRDRAAAGTA